MQRSNSLDGQVALITGAGTGIGAAIANSLSQSGAKIVLSGRTLERLESASKELLTESICLTCDVQDEAQIQNLIAKTIEHFGKLDILVNNAGTFGPTPFDEIKTSDLDQMLSTNLRAPFLLTQAAWPHLKASKGQIVNVSSVAGTRGFIGSSAYCASKFGLNGLTEVLALEGKQHGIRVFAVCPGAVATPLWERLEGQETLNRMMKPETVADLVLWMLTSPREVELEKVVIVNYASPWG